MSEVDLEARVLRHLRYGSVWDMHRDDRLPLDALSRRWAAQRRVNREGAEALARAIAAAVSVGEPEVVGQVLRFFQDHPTAEGGDALMAVARVGSRWMQEQPEPTPGSVCGTLWTSLLRALLSGPAALPEEVRAAARVEVASGRGRCLIYPLAQADPEWAREGVRALLPVYPDATSTLFRVLVGQGVPAEEAVATVSSWGDAVGLGRLEDELRYRYRGEPELLVRLLVRVGAP
ncbi:MAG: hypothetical protein JXX28_04230 [Deltaproteobacteria bacterium]|nr:hypothetical protein [Deltaproteobacteria bacterium]